MTDSSADAAVPEDDTPPEWTHKSAVTTCLLHAHAQLGTYITDVTSITPHRWAIRSSVIPREPDWNFDLSEQGDTVAESWPWWQPLTVKTPDIQTRLRASVAEELWMRYAIEPTAARQTGVGNTVRLQQRPNDEFCDVFSRAFELDHRSTETYTSALLGSSPPDNVHINWLTRVDKQRIVAVASLHTTNGHGFLYNIGTDPRHRGNGHASALIRAALRLASHNNSSDVWLQCEPASDAQRIYTASGFKPVGSAITYLRLEGS